MKRALDNEAVNTTRLAHELTHRAAFNRSKPGNDARAKEHALLMRYHEIRQQLHRPSNMSADKQMQLYRELKATEALMQH